MSTTDTPPFHVLEDSQSTDHIRLHALSSFDGNRQRVFINHNMTLTPKFIPRKQNNIHVRKTEQVFINPQSKLVSFIYNPNSQHNCKHLKPLTNFSDHFRLPSPATPGSKTL
ncbi:hypothetical protein QVD17_03083 [Tagetes erecta]|uniref:Uncharacterized protein n=1 Tax=Tagetes erecta TaxID=13708 RepID=A0AAD8LAB6_TARER|nr:hypothetical protein QVD17_03083 [Tagetes erecta]